MKYLSDEVNIDDDRIEYILDNMSHNPITLKEAATFWEDVEEAEYWEALEDFSS